MNYEIEQIKACIDRIANSPHFDYLRITKKLIFNSLSVDDQQSIKDDALKTFFECFPPPKAAKLNRPDAKDMLFEFLLTKDKDVLKKLCSIL